MLDCHHRHPRDRSHAVQILVFDQTGAVVQEQAQAQAPQEDMPGPAEQSLGEPQDNY